MLHGLRDRYLSNLVGEAYMTGAERSNGQFYLEFNTGVGAARLALCQIHQNLPGFGGKDL
jgi:hypothetical protein